jgi:hypothetical protein
VRGASTLSNGPYAPASILERGIAKARAEVGTYRDEAPALDPAADFDPANLFPPDRLDPWDCQADPALWDDDTDADRWELGPAADHDEPAATLDLAGLVAKQAEAFRAWPIAAGAIIADALEELAAKIQATDARTSDQYRARIETLEAEARQLWEDIGFEQGKAHARAEGRRRLGARVRSAFEGGTFED